MALDSRRDNLVKGVFLLSISVASTVSVTGPYCRTWKAVSNVGSMEAKAIPVRALHLTTSERRRMFSLSRVLLLYFYVCKISRYRVSHSTTL